MLKLISLIAILAVFPYALFPQISIENNNLKDKVKIQKIMEIIEYKATQINTPSENFEIEFQYLFDSMGNMNEKNSFYNELSIQKEIFAYDSKGNISDESWYNNANSLIYSSYTTYEFDKKGYIIAKNIFNSDSTIRKSVLNQYDENGLLQESEVKEYFEDGENYKEIFSYDIKDKMVGHKIISDEGSETLNEIISYNENNNIALIQSVGDEGEKTISFEYDKDNNLMHFISETIDENGKDYTEEIYNYDVKGNLAEELIYDENKKLTDKKKFEIIF